jgi:hypothetical protein
MPHMSRTRDFHFELPEDWIDRTMVIWSAPPIAGQQVTPNIVIAYDTLGVGEDLAEFVNRQLKQLMTKGKSFHLDVRRDTLLDARAAVELVFRWDSGTGMLKQRQIYSSLPDRRVVTFVHTAGGADFDRADPQFAEIQKTFRWHQVPSA